MEFDKTMHFEVEKIENLRTKEILKEVYEALQEKGYNPINQLVGYILSGDPTYITSHNNARSLIMKLSRCKKQNKNNRKRRTIRKNGKKLYRYRR